MSKWTRQWARLLGLETHWWETDSGSAWELSSSSARTVLVESLYLGFLENMGVDPVHYFGADEILMSDKPSGMVLCYWRREG